jgi:hypothetical protein
VSQRLLWHEALTPPPETTQLGSTSLTFPGAQTTQSSVALSKWRPGAQTTHSVSPDAGSSFAGRNLPAGHWTHALLNTR